MGSPAQQHHGRFQCRQRRALKKNTAGIRNTAAGFSSLTSNTTGNHNTADGVQALSSNSTGGSNTATGVNALFHNTTGSNNTGLGFNAGCNLTTGSNNIDIGNAGGAAAEANTIRIGTQGTQTATFIAGIFNSSVSGGAVEVSSTGKLGMVISSARYKHDIRDMGEEEQRFAEAAPGDLPLQQRPCSTGWWRKRSPRSIRSWCFTAPTASQ